MVNQSRAGYWWLCAVLLIACGALCGCAQIARAAAWPVMRRTEPARVAAVVRAQPLSVVDVEWSAASGSVWLSALATRTPPPPPHRLDGTPVLAVTEAPPGGTDGGVPAGDGVHPPPGASGAGASDAGASDAGLRQTPSPTPTPFAEVHAELALLYQEPNADSGIVEEVVRGRQFWVDARTDDTTWLRVCCINQRPYWIAAADVVVHNDISGVRTVALPSPTPTFSPTHTLTATPTRTPAPTATHTQTPTPAPTAFAEAAGNRVDVYEGPGEVYPWMLALGPGVEFPVVGQSADGEWLALCCIGADILMWVALEHLVVTNDWSGVPKVTPSPMPTNTPMPTPSHTPVPTPTPPPPPPPPPTFTHTPTHMPTRTPTAIPTRTATSLPTRTPTSTPTPTRTPTPTPVSIDLSALAVVVASDTAQGSTDTCGNPTSFDAANVLDGNRATAWRVAGDGVGESLVFSWERPVVLRRIELVPGYDKRDPCARDTYGREIDWCAYNRVPRRVAITFDDGASRTLPLRRQCEWQGLTLTDPVETQTVTITILDSYPQPADPDWGRDRTPVSEVRFTGYVP